VVAVNPQDVEVMTVVVEVVLEVNHTAIKFKIMIRILFMEGTCGANVFSICTMMITGQRQAIIQENQNSKGRGNGLRCGDAYHTNSCKCCVKNA
jgi:hypothetical protein